MRRKISGSVAYFAQGAKMRFQAVRFGVTRNLQTAGDRESVSQCCPGVGLLRLSETVNVHDVDPRLLNEL